MQDFNSLLYDLYINALIILLIPFPCQNHLLYTQQIFLALIVSPNFHALVLYTHPTRPTNISERTFKVSSPYQSLFVRFYPNPGFLSEAKSKEFEPRLKHGWFYLKLYSLLRDLSRRSIGTGFGRFSDAI